MENNNATALVLGGTGLVGSELVKLLISDDRIRKVVLIGRRSSEINHPKVSDLIINFDHPDEWSQHIQGNILFSAFGTTIKKAGSQDEQYKIDYKYQWEVANAASNHGVKTCVLISSVGAKADSKIFYNRMKGELDRDVKTLPFANIIILKPSLLVGNRQEHRSGEKIATFLGSIFKYIPFVKKYRPIHSSIVAKAMLNVAFSNTGIRELVADELFIQAND